MSALPALDQVPGLETRNGRIIGAAAAPSRPSLQVTAGCNPLPSEVPSRSERGFMLIVELVCSTPSSTPLGNAQTRGSDQ
jgi:hypothetical protein